MFTTKQLSKVKQFKKNFFATLCNPSPSQLNTPLKYQQKLCTSVTASNLTDASDCTATTTFQDKAAMKDEVETFSLSTKRVLHSAKLKELIVDCRKTESEANPLNRDRVVQLRLVHLDDDLSCFLVSSQ